MSVRVESKGFAKFLDYVEKLPDVTKTAARIALNDTADLAVKKIIPPAITKEIAFPQGYLDDPDKLRVDERATNENLEASILARQRPTSLARFVIDGSLGQKGKLTVEVKPGEPVNLSKAFLVRLNAGPSFDQDHYNLGLAIRLKPGQAFQNKKSFNASQLGAPGTPFENVLILYGPSVDQVFQSTLDETEPEIAEDAETEFYRQFARLAGG